MEITQLRYFLRIAELHSFTKAAAACGVTQPALSQQMAKLEEELGCPVFERRGRKVELSEVGKQLLPRAIKVLSLVEDTARELKDDGQTGKLVVAAIPTIAPYFLPGLLRQFRDTHPQARVEVHEAVTDELLRLCARGEVDFGILALPVKAQYLEVEPLMEEPLLVVLHPDHPLTARNAIDVSELKAEPFVLLGEAHCLSDSIQGFCRRNAFQPVATGRMSQLATVQELVALGHGLSLIPEMACQLDNSPTRVYRPVKPPVPKRTIAACWNSYRYQSRLAKSFLELLRTSNPDLS